MNDLRAFFHTVGATPNPGAAADELDAFEARTGLSLPPQVRAFYGATNGLTIESGGWMKILTLAEVMPYVEGEVMPFVGGVRHGGIPEVWGYFPFTDCNDS